MFLKLQYIVFVLSGSFVRSDSGDRTGNDEEERREHDWEMMQAKFKPTLLWRVLF